LKWQGKVSETSALTPPLSPEERETLNTVYDNRTTPLQQPLYKIQEQCQDAHFMEWHEN
jgi:hypothetical protein